MDVPAGQANENPAWRLTMATGKVSAGLMMYRLSNGVLEVFLAHPGGPFLRNKDWGYWGIPKGEVESGEDLLAAAVREFGEETGLAATGELLPLGSVVQASGQERCTPGRSRATGRHGRATGEQYVFAGVAAKFGQTGGLPEIVRRSFFPCVALRKISSGRRGSLL
jgi:predicted NUDIX family NTP pyrophosphohydrolase